MSHISIKNFEELKHEFFRICESKISDFAQKTSFSLVPSHVVTLANACLGVYFEETKTSSLISVPVQVITGLAGAALAILGFPEAIVRAIGLILGVIYGVLTRGDEWKAEACLETFAAKVFEPLACGLMAFMPVLPCDDRRYTLKKIEDTI